MLNKISLKPVKVCAAVVEKISFALKLGKTLEKMTVAVEEKAY